MCLDETTKQLVGEITVSIPASPGQPERIDYEYERNGVGALFMMCAPLEGWREVSVRAQKTAVDYAQCPKALADEHFAEAEKIILIQDNLNTHKPTSLYETFELEEAHRLKQRFEFHYTPKHASWLNIAECELSALARQCLDRRFPDVEHLSDEVREWIRERNQFRVFCSDMWKPYLKVIDKRLPQAVHVLDKFHIVANLHKAADEVRRQEASRMAAEGYEPILKKSRYCFLKRPENLTPNQEVKLKELLQYALKSVRAYQLKESFGAIWDYKSIRWAR